MSDRALEEKRYIESEFGSLVGKTVGKVRPLLPVEMEDMDWGTHRTGFVIIFKDGTAIIPSSDEEGNDAGFLLMADLEPVK